MSKANEPAFPNQYGITEGGESIPITMGGLTKRELSAFICLQGILASGASGDKATKSLAAIIYSDMLLEDLSKRRETAPESQF